MPIDRCPLCQATGSVIFHQQAMAPVNSCLLVPNREEALSFPVGRIALCFCPACGFIFNSAFEQALIGYSSRYEETQGYSPTFCDFQKSQASQLVNRYGLCGKTVVEIGCGKGEFLSLLCENGDNRGIGYDPGYIPGRLTPQAEARITVFREYFTGQRLPQPGDFFCCKMTLEHISPVREFLDLIRLAMEDNPQALLFLQVPDAERILRDCAFEDIYYEHCSYFSVHSLTNLLGLCGFASLEYSREFAGQYLTVVARPVAGRRPVTVPPAAQSLLAVDFAAKWGALSREWHDRFRHWHQQGQKVILWGGGSKAVALLTSLGNEATIIAVVDINPHRQGSFLPLSGLEIIAPDRLCRIHPEVVIIMNRIYREEISIALSNLGLFPEIVCL